MKDFGSVIRSYLVASDSAASSTLDGAVSASDLSWTLADGSSFTDDELLVLKVDSEYTMGTVSGNTVTIEPATRGAFGTSAATHANGAAVKQCTLFDLVGDAVTLDAPTTNNFPNIWIDMETEGQNYGDAPMFDDVVFFRCFGGDDEDGNPMYASAVYRLLNDRLSRKYGQTGGLGTLVNARQQSGGDVLSDPDVDWVFVETTYAITVR
jgi:hypothetical protein